VKSVKKIKKIAVLADVLYQIPENVRISLPLYENVVGLFCLNSIYTHKKGMLAYEHKSFHHIRDKPISLFHSE
jgi:hypothetical protein